MLKRLPGRNNRSKGIKVKHILQICLLLGICFWLVYQVKHSHDKKKEFDGNDVKSSMRKMSEDEIPKLGRKDLYPHGDNSKSEKRVEEEEEEKHREEEREYEDNKHGEEELEDEGSKQEEEEEEEEGEDEGNRHETEEQDDDDEEEENKDEDADAEDGGRSGGDDEIDENDQERKEQEPDRDEEFIDEEKEFEEGIDGKESKANSNVDRETQVGKENSSEHQDNDDDSQDSHEAREKHYKGDDASSAVTHDVHDTQVISTEAEKINSENSEFNVLQNEYKINTTKGDNRNENTSVSVVGEGEIAHNGTSLKVSAGEQKVDSSSSIFENSQVLVHSNNQTEGDNSIMGSIAVSNNLTESSTKASDSSRKFGLVPGPHSIPTQNATVDGATTVEDMKVETSLLEHTNISNIASDFNSTFSTDFDHENATLGKSSDATDAEDARKSLKLNGTVETEDNNLATTTIVDTDASQIDKSNSELEYKRIVEISDSTKGTDDAVQHDLIDSSDIHVTEDEKEIQSDLDTLPKIKTDGDENEEAADE